MPKREADLLLEDIRAALARIERYTSGLDQEQFLSDEKTIDAVARNLEIIGEAVRLLPNDFKAEHTDIPWAQIGNRGPRNRIVHDYLGYWISPKLSDRRVDVLLDVTSIR